jgi:hypothetical protein
MFSSLIMHLFRGRKRLSSPRPRRRTRPVLEWLERRDAPAAFTAGDIVVSRVASGAPLTSSATATFLDEYNPITHALVQTIALPTGAGNALTEGGTFTSEGRLSAAADGHTLSIAGYRQTPGGAISAVNGVIGLVNPDGTVDTTTQIPSADLGSFESVRATAAADGLGFWVATGNFVRYVPFGNGGSTASIAVSNYFPSPSAAAISPAGQLYVDGGAGAQSNGVPPIDGPASIDTGLPISAGQTGTVLAGFPTTRDAAGNFPTSQQFVISPDGNTIFVADSRTDTFGGILEFFQSTPGNWAELGNLQIGSGADSGLRGLSADFSGVNPILYATTTNTSVNRVIQITGGTLNGTAPSFAFTTIATAAANEGFRGVALVPSAPGATPSSVTLTVAGDPSTYGTGDTLTASMDSSETGWVSFQQNGVEFGAAPLVSGTATFTTAGNLAAGSYNVVAVYTGDSTFAPSTSALQSVTINQATTTTTLTESANPVATGILDTLTATIGSVPPGTAPTGTVTFTDVTTSTTLGTSPVSQVIVNQAGNPVIQFVSTFTASISTLGSHILSATYNGDTNFVASTGLNTLLVVNQTTTTVTTSDPNPTANPSSSATLTAAVTSSGGTPTGFVEFFDNLLPFVGATITSTTDAGGTVTVTAANNVPFSNGQTVAITGVNVAGYNGVFTISGVSGNTFQYAVGDTGLANGSGGVAGLAVALDGSGNASATINTALLQAAPGVADVLTPGLHSISAVYSPDAAGFNSFFTSTGVYEQAVQAAVFGAGDTLVYRVGDGQTPLIAPPNNPNGGTAAIGSTIFVDEYDGTGTLIQSIILPSADGGTSVNINTATEAGTTVTVTTVGPHGLEQGETITIAGMSDPGYNGTFTVTGVTSTTFTFTDGVSGLNPATGGTASNNNVHGVVGNGQQSATEQMTKSGDGHFVFLVGYDTNPLNTATAPAIPTGPGSGSVPRAVARIKFDGTVNTIGLNNVQTAGNFNGVYSPDGHQVYASGGNGVSYFSSFVPTSTLQSATATITSTGFTVTGLEAAGTDLVAIGASSNLVQKYTGFPTAPAALNALPGVSTATDPNQTFVIDAYFTHLNGAGAPDGINTMYLSDDGPGFAHGEITKWAFDGTTWHLVDSITAGTGNSAISFYWLAGKTDLSGNVTLEATYGNGGNSDTGPGQLYSITDTNGWNHAIGTGGVHSDAVAILAAVGSSSNRVFRGLAFVPTSP